MLKVMERCFVSNVVSLSRRKDIVFGSTVTDSLKRVGGVQ